jgi:hypothetical protein
LFTSVGGILNFDSMTFNPLVFAVDVVGIEHDRRLALLIDRLLIGLRGAVVVGRQL